MHGPLARALDEVGIPSARFGAALAAEGVCSLSDLRALGREDMKELGLNMGMRTRLAAWQEAQRAPRGAPEAAGAATTGARLAKGPDGTRGFGGWAN